MKAVTKKVCSACGSERSVSDFYENLGSTRQFNDRSPFCRPCAKNKYETYSKMFNENAAMWLICSEIGMPYIQGLWDMAKEDMAKASPDSWKANNAVTFYFMKLRSNRGDFSGFWDSDKTFEEVAYPERALALQKSAVEEGASSGQKERSCKQSDEEIQDDEAQQEQWIKKWGVYAEGRAAYVFLDETFEEYTSEILEMDPNLKNRYRDLCKAEWRKRKADESGDITEIARAQDNLSKLLVLLKLNNYQENKQSETEKFIERMAWTIENVKPAECEDLDKYKDFSGFEKTWGHIMRCVQNLCAGTRQYPDIPKAER